jgi:hypothetical protein
MRGHSQTTETAVIRRWAEDRGGWPASVQGTEDGDEAGVLRIAFDNPPADDSHERLEKISWDDFFQKFEEKKLAFLYQEETEGGDQSRFFKLVSRTG